MGAIIGVILPLAVGVALSPLPIMAVILLLLSARGQRNAVAFTIGWALGAFAECAVVVLLASSATLATPVTTRPRLEAVIKLLLGLIMLALALFQWRTQPAPGEMPKPPRWMQALDRLNAAMALGLGALYVAANIKNVPLTIAAATSIGTADILASEKIVAAAVFALFCTLGPGLPVLVYRVGGEHAKTTLSTWKIWLEQHNGAVMAVLLLFFGVKFLGDALAGLL